MAKYLKQTTDDASKFFDEMEEKMEAQDSKKRKLSQKPGLSQPELSFLQFNPKSNNDKENVCYFSNKSFSQPPFNKSTLTNKKMWRPPAKVLDHHHAFELKYSKDECFFVKDEKPIKGCETSLHINKDLEHNSVELPSAIFPSSHSYQQTNKSQTITKNVSHSYPNPENPENVFFFHQNPSSLEISGVSSENLRSTCGLNLTKKECKEMNTPLNREPCFSISKEFKLLDNKPESMFMNKTVSDETLSNVCDKKDDRSNMADLMNESLALGNCEKVNYQVENDNLELENENYQQEEILNFSEMLTQINPNLRDKKTEVHKEAESGGAGAELNYIENKGVGILFFGCDKTEYKHNASISEQNEQEDIINSIDMILSEGKNTPNNSSLEEENDVCINNEECKNSQTLADSVFESSSSSNNSDKNDELCYGSNSSNPIAYNSLLEISKNIRTYEKDSVEIKLEVIGKHNLNIEQEESIAKKKVTENILPLTTSISEENKLNKCANETIRTNINEPAATNNTNNSQAGQNIMGEDDKNIHDVIDDEYSCLMISNSQMLEIENNYYEKPLKEKSASIISNDKMCKVSNGSLSNKKLVSVGTQTEVLMCTFSEQCEPLKTPHLQWPSKMAETQNRLRETIKEVQRLNACLVQVRQEIWPRQNINGRNDDICFPKVDRGSSSWNKN